MQSTNDKIQLFIKSVCEEIKFKGIHSQIARELSDHIEDQKNSYIGQGMDEETALNRAIEQMGDPRAVGRALNNVHRPKVEWSILFLTAALVLTGGILQYILSGVSAGELYNNSNMFDNFLKYAPIGVAVLIFAYYSDYTKLMRFSKIIYFLLFCATVCGLLLLNQVNGTYRHVYYSALLFIPVFAGVVCNMRNKGYAGIILSGAYCLGAAFMCLLAPTFTGFFILTFSCLIVLTVAVIKNHFIVNIKTGLAIIYVPTVIAGISGFFIMVANSPYRLDRLISMFRPELDPYGSGWMILMIRRLLNSSRLVGSAVLDKDLAGMSVEQILPDWSAGFALTYVIARFGLVAGFAIIAMMLILIIRMFSSVMKQKNFYGFMLSFSVSLAITGQILFYVLSNLGVIAPVSATLPIVSYGASGFILNMLLLGMLLCVYRRTNLVIDTGRSAYTGNDSSMGFISYSEGKLIIDFHFARNKISLHSRKGKMS